MPRIRLATQSTAHDSALAQQIGARIREARKRSGFTQQQLAGDRYTKAYVSALETGIARPSMVALSYLAERLSNAHVSVTMLARGVPVGGELDWLDDGTIAQAMRARRPA